MKHRLKVVYERVTFMLVFALSVLFVVYIDAHDRPNKVGCPAQPVALPKRTLDSTRQFVDWKPQDKGVLEEGKVPVLMKEKDVMDGLEVEVESYCDAVVGGESAVSRLGVDSLCMFWREGKHKNRGVATEKITLTTQLSVNRLDRLLDLARQWHGPVSASVLVCSQSQVITLETWYRAIDKSIAKFLDIHVAVVREDPYPINTLRNIALEGVSNEEGFTFVVDVDAWLGSDMQGFIEELSKPNRPEGNDGRGGGIVYTVPSFEFSPGKQGSFPRSLAALKELYEQNVIRVMHAGRRSYSGPFRPDAWIRSGARNGLEPLNYEVMYEPYFVMRTKQERPVKFPEQFVGRGFNKQALHFELFAAGYEYLVLGSSFVVDRKHTYDEWSVSSVNLEQNKPIWYKFREDVSRKYNLTDCRADDWLRCDKRGVGCHRVCQERRVASERKKDGRLGGNSKKRSNVALSKSRDEVFWKLYLSALETRTLSGERKSVDRSQCNTGIDVVYTWVNGSDPSHQAIQKLLIPEAARRESIDLGDRHTMVGGNLSFRFRDYGRASTLRYSLRSLFKHAPWVNNIWIVTAGSQRPSWMNEEGLLRSQIRFVSHKSIFRKPEEELPTMNSCAIETQIHRIAGLSECYLYLNDDFFLNTPLSLDDLWPGKDPAPRAFFTGERAPRFSKDPWQQKVANVAKMLTRDIGMKPDYVFSVGHHGYFFIKSIVQQLETSMQAEFDATGLQKWRTPRSLWVPFAYSNYLAWNFNTRPERASAFYFRVTDHGGSKSIYKAFQHLKESKSQWACFNDLASEITADIEQALFDGFEALFPTKPPYEK